jgi:hypothetical protein
MKGSQSGIICHKGIILYDKTQYIYERFSEGWHHLS